MLKRTLVTLCVVGSVLIGGAAPIASAHHVGAGKHVTLQGEGFTIQIPATWKYQIKVPTSQIFTRKSLQLLAPNTLIAVSPGTLDAIAAVVQHSALSQSAIKSVESAMLRDNTKLIRPVTYKVGSANGDVTVSATSVASQNGKTLAEAVTAILHAGKTLYFLAGMTVDNTAKSDAGSKETIAALGSITLR